MATRRGFAARHDVTRPPKQGHGAKHGSGLGGGDWSRVPACGVSFAGCVPTAGPESQLPMHAAPILGRREMDDQSGTWAGATNVLH